MEPYPMKWFRFYDEALNDPKVQRLPDASFKYWVNLLCLANQGKPRGRFRRADVAYALRITDERAEKMLAYFIEKDLFEQDGEFLIPHGWDARQFQSDNITERVQKHRRNVSGNVSRSLRETPPDTETETETETEQTPPSPPAGGVSVEFDQFWSEVIRREPSRAKAYACWVKATKKAAPAVILAGLRRWVPVWRAVDDPSKVPYITTWLNDERWTVERPTMPKHVNGHTSEPIPEARRTPEEQARLDAERTAALTREREREGTAEERWRRKQDAQARPLAGIPKS